MAELSSQTLHLVAQELNNELNEARAALELFGDQQDNVALLHRCNDHLHRVHGALRVAEVYGAALLAEEMGQVTHYLVENFAEKRHLAEGLDALMRAMVQLPTYLERVLSGGRDMALVLLPLLNDLRAVRGHALLSEGTLLLLNLSSDQQASPVPAGAGEGALGVAQWARKLRTRFQLGLLGWIKGERSDQNLEILSRAAEKLEQVATTQTVFQLWWVVGAVLEALRDGGLDGSASIKRLLGQADRDMRRLYEQGEARYADSPPLELLNNLLYYVARARSGGPRVAAVRASFRLDELLPVDDSVEQARESLSAPSVKLMKTVAAAIKEDLSRVKDALDIFVRRDGTRVEELAPQLELLKKIGDTLGVLGLGDLRDKVQTETTDLQAMVAQQVPVSEGALLRMAATLIKVEDSLDEQLVGMIVPTAGDGGAAAIKPVSSEDIEFRQVTEAVLRECIVNMARIKEAVALSMDKTRDGQAIDQIPALVRGITAGLLMLGKSRAAEVMEGIDRALAKFVRAAGPQPQEAVDRLADAIVAIEYYMETLQAGRADPWYMLDNAESCIQYLNEMPAVPRAETAAHVAAQAQAQAGQAESSARTVIALLEGERTEVLDHNLASTAVLLAETGARSVTTQTVAAQTIALPTAAAPGGFVTPPVMQPVAGDVEPEFLELFIEEAKDEIVKLKEQFPRWDENPQDQDALVHLRRSFHTLKGSGRMVGAQLIGEFSWAVESLLNRVISKTLERTPDMMALLRQAIVTVPELVEQLESGRRPPSDVTRIMSEAFSLSGARPGSAAKPAVFPSPVEGVNAAQSTASGARADVAPAPVLSVEPPRPSQSSQPAFGGSPSGVVPAQDQSSESMPLVHAALAHEPLDFDLGPPPGAPEIEIPAAVPAETSVLAAASPAASVESAGVPQRPGVVPMDPALHDIYAKETAGHLAVIRQFIASSELASVPYPVTEALHRSCHTLSGTAKTADARQGIKIAEPLNRYIRKLYDSSTGLPEAGLEVLKEAVTAIQQVVDHINEDTGFFFHHARIVAQLRDLEHGLDSELARVADGTMEIPAMEVSGGELHGAVPYDVGVETGGNAGIAPESEVESAMADELASATEATGVFDPDQFPDVSPRGLAPADDIVEIPELDANELLAWSYENFPANDATVRQPKLTPAAGADLESQASPAASQVPADPLAQEDHAFAAPLAGEHADADATLLAAVDFDVGSSEDVAGIEYEAIGIGDEELIPVDDFDAVSDVQQDTGIETGTPAESDTRLVAALEAELAAELGLPPLAASPVEPPVEPLPMEPFAEVPEPALPAAEAAMVESVPPSVVEVPVADVAVSTDGEPQDDESAPDADFDPEVAAIFTEEAAELLDTADNALASWARDLGNNALVFELKRALHTLKGGARMAGVRGMGDLSHELESLMERVEAGQVAAEPPVFEGLQASLDALQRMRDCVSRSEVCPSPRELIARIRVLAGHAAPQAAPAPTAVTEVPAERPAEIAVAMPSLQPAPGVVDAATEAAGAADAAATAEPSELLTVASADEVPQLEWTDAPVAAEPAAADITGADIAAGSDAALESGDAAEIEAEFGADELGAAAPRLSVRVEESPPSFVESSPSVLDVAALPPELPPDVPAAAEQELTPPVALPPGREPPVHERQEFARVDAELLDNLLNNAGEVSIFRARLEQQVGSIEFNLAELGRTVTRLKDQLRKLELETEAQILHRHQEEHPSRADFDPLELDRYSVIQQLTRALAESVSDVGSIEGLLENLTREGQNLLLQQARVVTELQNGLMRTRMVPFQRHVQRLSRLVRQVAADTGKRAELAVAGAAGELDRQVLDRMLPPFEHMLRNAIVHGIEPPEARRAAGKSEVGTIRIGLHREGAEMVIVLEDDGAGIDVNAVRERAQARGLVDAGRLLTDEEALQLIQEPGFSTASTLTQHAGRGVGMDVVVNEIKKLGGALFTESQLGRGVKFTIRLPFTLAITQALIVRTGDELYALPLPSVEGVARVPRSEVQSQLAEDTPSFNYGGQIYRFQHLGAFVGGVPSVLPEGDVSVPVILIRAGEHSTALVLDELVGSREMVVKSVGPQISAIRGISGATILGDGRIVIILDMGALVRSEWRGRSAMELSPRPDRRTFALVVDDSITVRRVTQRLLERNGIRVMTAKDGVDALSILQEHVPDVILLDIEMPRMDGYELAAHVRSDTRLAAIPIVMITSRVGEKHRARAIELGVNDYLGKPYQENQLLDAIEPLVAMRRQGGGPA